MTRVELGSITITYELDNDDVLTGVSVDGDIPVIIQLGMLAFAKDAILQGDLYDHCEGCDEEPY